MVEAGPLADCLFFTSRLWWEVLGAFLWSPSLSRLDFVGRLLRCELSGENTRRPKARKRCKIHERWAYGSRLVALFGTTGQRRGQTHRIAKRMGIR